MNYQTCTVEELANHFKGKSSQAISQQLKYYTDLKNIATVLKIKRARLLMKQMKLSSSMESL